MGPLLVEYSRRGGVFKALVSLKIIT